MLAPTNCWQSQFALDERQRLWRLSEFLGRLFEHLAGENEIPGLETLRKLRISLFEQSMRRFRRRPGSTEACKAHRSPQFPGESTLLMRALERSTQQHLRLGLPCLSVLRQETSLDAQQLRREK
jgi:hypothetical protein